MAGRRTAASRDLSAAWRRRWYSPYWTANAARNATRPRPRYALSLSALLRRVGAEAARANARPNLSPTHRHPPHLQVRHEPAVDAVLRVTDVVSVLRLFAANCATLGHEAPSDWDLRLNGVKGAGSDVSGHRIVPWALHDLEVSNCA